MKRFALFYNLIPEARMRKIPWLVNNFDFIKFVPDVGFMNNYKAIYTYGVSGFTHDIEGYCEWFELPKYLREHGVTKPKILYQLDNFGLERNLFSYSEIAKYADCVLEVMNRGWITNKPNFLMCFPIVSDFKHWTPLEEKLDRAITVVRHNAPVTPSQEIADELGLPLDVLGGNLDKVYGEEYIKCISKYKIAIDYHTRFISWSRFGPECAYAGTPILGQYEVESPLFLNPQLWGSIKNAKIMGRKLLDDTEFYEECRARALKATEYLVSPERCEALLKTAMVCCGIIL